jgi:hypothetical protein
MWTICKKKSINTTNLACGRSEGNNNVRIYTSIYIDFAFSYSSRGKESFLLDLMHSNLFQVAFRGMYEFRWEKAWVSDEKWSYEIKQYFYF